MKKIAGFVLTCSLCFSACSNEPMSGNLGRWSGEFHVGGENRADYAISIPAGRQVTFRITVRVNESEFPDRIGTIRISILDPVTYQWIENSPLCDAGRQNDPARPNPNTCVWVFNGARRPDGRYVLRVTDQQRPPQPDRWIGYTIDADL